MLYTMRSGRLASLLSVLLTLLLLIVRETHTTRIDSTYHDLYREGIECGSLYERTKDTAGCHPLPWGCGRVVIDDFLGTEDVKRLRIIAEVSMTNATTEGGPTIADINTGKFAWRRMMHASDS